MRTRTPSRLILCSAQLCLACAAVAVLLPQPGGAQEQSTAAAQAAQSASLQQAVRLTQQGDYRGAMLLYHQVFGESPPLEWALAFYETEAATSAGRPHAVAGLQDLVQRYPDDPRFAIALGKVLTYDPATRDKGQQLLSRYPSNPDAAQALGQSLLWDSGNPASAPKIRAFLDLHRNAQLAAALSRLPGAETTAPPGRPVPSSPRPITRSTPTSSAASSAPSRVSPREKAAVTAELSSGMRALRAQQYPEAERAFLAVLAKDPHNARAEAGLGYVRLAQGNTTAAIASLEQAHAALPADRNLAAALENARFAQTLAASSQAARPAELEAAEKQLRAATAARPHDPSALAALAAILLRVHRPAEAEVAYQRLLDLTPGSPQAWRGLVQAAQAAGAHQHALLTDSQLPLALRLQLQRDPGYLLALSLANRYLGRDAESARLLDLGLELPLPPNAAGVPAEDLDACAGLLLLSGQAAKAAALFQQAVSLAPADLGAAEGRIEAFTAAGQTPAALALLDQMQPAGLDISLRDPGFAAAAARAAIAEGLLDQAESLLARAVSAQQGSTNPTPVLELAAAELDLKRGLFDQALAIDTRIVARAPQRPDAWAALLSALHAAGRDQDALAELTHVPPQAKVSLASDIAFQETLASIAADTGRWVDAQVALARVEQLYTERTLPIPPAVELSRASLLLNGGSDLEISQQLTALPADSSLTPNQQSASAEIWAVWSVRRALDSSRKGDPARSRLILRAARHAFPGNPLALKIIAAGDLEIHAPEDAVSIFAAPSSAPATPGEYATAAAAALAANNPGQAQAWIAAGLKLAPADPTLLTLAARLEQGRGNSRRAIAFYRASLKAMPAATADPAALILPSGRAPASKDEWQDELRFLLAPGSPAVPTQPALPPPPAAGPLPLRDYTPPGPALMPLSSSHLPFLLPDGGRSELLSVSYSLQRTPAPQVPQPRQFQPQPDPQQYPQPGRAGSAPSAPTRAGTPAASHPHATAPAVELALPAAPTLPPAPPPHLPAPEVESPPPALPRPAVELALLPPAQSQPIVLAVSRPATQQSLNGLLGGFTGYTGLAGSARYRAGTPGLDRLFVLESPAELSLVAGRSLRLTAIAEPVYLDAGVLNPTGAAAGTTFLGTQPVSASTPSLHSQTLQGVGGELQLATRSLALAAGYTPFEFPTQNITGRFAFSTAARHLTLFASRQPVRETVLSYAGLHDPGQASSTSTGPVWGGVVSTLGGLSFNWSRSAWTLYASADGGTLRGAHVLANDRVEGSAGASARLGSSPRFGTFSLGGNAHAMHFNSNESGLTYGQGGYFSPRQYLAVTVPLTFTSAATTRFRYETTAAYGALTTQFDAAPFYPLDPALQSAFPSSACTAAQIAAHTCGFYPAQSATSLLYDVRARFAYLAGSHWYLGGFAFATNALRFQDVSTGFSLRYTFLPQQSSEGSPSGISPEGGLVPVQLP